MRRANRSAKRFDRQVPSHTPVRRPGGSRLWEERRDPVTWRSNLLPSMLSSVS